MSDDRSTRRDLFGLGAASAAMLGLVLHAFTWARSLLPNVRYEPSKIRTLGDPKQFPPGRTYISDHRVFVIRDDKGLRALSAVCPHLACTVGMSGDGYHCPCHGSRFDAVGAKTGGPTPGPLQWHPLSLSGSGALVVNLGQGVSADVVFEDVGGGS